MKQELQHASDLELKGRWQEAKAIYEKWYSQKPENGSLFNRLKNICIEAGEYDRALELIAERKKRFPKDWHLDISKARINYKMGKEDTAFKMWNQIIDENPANSSIYQSIASVMLMERLMDEAAEIYLKGREKIGRKDLFAFHLSNLYAARMDYSRATEELLRYLVIFPNQVSLIENQIARYPGTERVIGETVRQLEKAIQSNPGHVGLRQILVSVYKKAEMYPEAFEAAKGLERILEHSKKGEALFHYAQQTFLAGAAQHAQKVYLHILTSYPQFGRLDQVLYGLAQCHQALNRQREAIVIYNRILSEYPASPRASAALYKKGLLYRDILFDHQQAIAAFEELIEKYPNAQESVNSRLDLADCHTALGELNKAEAVFREIIQKPSKKDRYWIKAVVGISDILYLRGAFHEAITLLSELLYLEITPETMQDPVFNDGLKLYLFINEYRDRSPRQLARFARAEMAKRQRHYKCAVASIDSIIAESPDHSISSQALYLKAEIKMEMNDLTGGLESYQKLLGHFPNSLVADRALERIGWIYQERGDSKKALSMYETLLIDYPQSFLVEEIRNRIRRIEDKRK